VDAYTDPGLNTLQTNALLPILQNIENAGASGNYAQGDTIATISFSNITQTASFTLGVVYTNTIGYPWTDAWDYDSSFGGYTYLNGNGSTSFPYYTIDANGNLASGDV